VGFAALYISFKMRNRELVVIGAAGGACLKKRVQGYFPAGVRGVPEYKFPPRLGEKGG